MLPEKNAEAGKYFPEVLNRAGAEPSEVAESMSSEVAAAEIPKQKQTLLLTVLKS
jgi:hypothetical protein